MTCDGDYPRVGPSRDALGVVFGPSPEGDIEVADDQVHPRTGGLSVVPSWRDLPPGRIPKRLKSLMPDARGSNRFFCWCMGNGDFVDKALGKDLSLTVDEPKHGFIGPVRSMSPDQFQAALANTRTLWRKIAEDR